MWLLRVLYTSIRIRLQCAVSQDKNASKKYIITANVGLFKLPYIIIVSIFLLLMYYIYDQSASLGSLENFHKKHICMYNVCLKAYSVHC